MRAAFYDRVGAADEVLQIGELPTPSPGAGEVLVRMACSGVNPSDVKTRAGMRSRTLPFARIVPHSDGAGVIYGVGDGVEPERVGERVWLWNAAWGRAQGTAAEYVALPAAHAVPLPEGVDFATGACLGIPALTAHHAVAVDGGVKDQAVLVAGGGGAVGHYAVQMARLQGARQVIATAGNERSAELARAAGADVVLSYRSDDVRAGCAEATGGRGMDRVIEVDAAANIALDIAALRPGGRIVVYGSGAAEVPVPFYPAIVKNLALRFFIVYNLEPADRIAAIARLTSWLEDGRLQHNVARRLPLEQIAQAHRLVEQGAGGNVVLEVG
jgi:NADPH2:quinone reductase